VDDADGSDWKWGIIFHPQICCNFKVTRDVWKRDPSTSDYIIPIYPWEDDDEPVKWDLPKNDKPGCFSRVAPATMVFQRLYSPFVFVCICRILELFAHW
jgi:hypothetical protein